MTGHGARNRGENALGVSTRRRACATLRGVARGGDAVGEEADVRVPGTDETPNGSTVQGRLRSALLTRGWNRGPEPRIRFGHPVLPGLACLGAADRAGAAPPLVLAAAVRAAGP